MLINRSDPKIMREIASVKPEKVTDAYALDLHVRHITSAGHRPDAIRGRRGAILRLTNWLDPYNENPRVVIEATTDQLAAWQASKSDLAAKSLRTYISHIQCYYRWLVRPMRILVDSPAEDLITPMVRRRRPRPIPEEDLTYALTACVDSRMRAWLVLGAYAGLRSIDIASLDRDDVLTDQDVPMLRVRGKGDHEDLVPVGEQVISALSPFMGRRSGALFVDQAGRRLARDRIREDVNEFLANLGIPYTFHKLRHRYITWVYELNKDIRQAQRLARHRSIATTEGYVAISSAQDAETVRALDVDLVKRTRGSRNRRELSA
jgi:site-specific recombinase XerC